MDLHTAPPGCWHELEDFLLDDARRELAAGSCPLPVLAAAVDDEVVALGVLRPCEDTGPVPALVEVLALLLPLGVNRVALRFSGRAWSTLDPIPPVSNDVDLRARVVVLVQADGTQRPCSIATRLHECRSVPSSQGLTLGPALATDEEPPVAPLLDALGILLDRRDELEGDVSGPALVAQLGRVLLLGHQLTLSPELTARLTDASLDPFPPQRPRSPSP